MIQNGTEFGKIRVLREGLGERKTKLFRFWGWDRQNETVSFFGVWAVTRAVWGLGETVSFFVVWGVWGWVAECGVWKRNSFVLGEKLCGPR